MSKGHMRQCLNAEASKGDPARSWRAQRYREQLEARKNNLQVIPLLFQLEEKYGAEETCPEELDNEMGRDTCLPFLFPLTMLYDTCHGNDGTDPVRTALGM